MVPITEVFVRPTVRQVVFQVRFPSLFFMETKIGDFQLKIMRDFPKSSLVVRRQIVVVETGERNKLEDVPGEADDIGGKRIWQFSTGDDRVRLSVLESSLDITSEEHKTYNLGTEKRFRDAIKMAVDNFIAVTGVPIFSRIGLRYIDECPVPAVNNEMFLSWYNTSLNLSRFDLSEVLEMSFRARRRRGEHFFRYEESFRVEDGTPKLSLDFDGYAQNIDSARYLDVTDDLHGMLSKEFEVSLKTPVFQYMRGEIECQ